MTSSTPAEAAPTTSAPVVSVPTASARSGLVKPFAAMGIVATVGQMQRAGRDTIAMCLGEPTQGAPSPVLTRAAEVMSDGTGLGYSPIFGIPELREAIASHYRDWYGLDIAPDRIAVTTGSSGAFQTTFLTCFDVGDRVALARPGYGAYKNILAALVAKSSNSTAVPTKGSNRPSSFWPPPMPRPRSRDSCSPHRRTRRAR